MYNSNILFFDGVNRQIISKLETLSLLDIYSQWKRCTCDYNNAMFFPAFSYNTDTTELIK